nr:FAD-binding protein [Pseudomonas aeruginosa]
MTSNQELNKFPFSSISCRTNVLIFALSRHNPEPGCFGTFAGLKTDAQARVLDGGGQPIPGLYAAGADMASLFAGHYPSGGINLGPALTFGYIAGRHIAGALGYEQEQAQRG